MIVLKRVLPLFTSLLLIISTFTVVCRSYATAEMPQATLTGNIFDHGVDTDGNSLYDYLEIDAEINVTVTGNFQVRAWELVDLSSNYVYVNNYSQGFLEPGVRYLNFSFYGPTIFGSRLNPQSVSSIELDAGDFMLPVDSIHNVALSRAYNYTEFDPATYLTGRISDRGVDTDGDGLFNYLEVGIEFNVTDPGKYQVNMAGLLEQNGTMTYYLYDYRYSEEEFIVGLHMVYFNFSGSEISSKHFNPTNVSYISIRDVANSYSETSRLDSAPLSKRYDHTLFNTPSKDIQINFKVYPDGTVAVDGALDFAHMYPENTYVPQTNATVRFSTTENTTTVQAGGTMAFPYGPYSSYNMIEGYSRSLYENGLLNSTADTSMILPSEAAGAYPLNATDVDLNAVYVGGMFDVIISGQTVMPTAYGSIFPFNISDVTVRADFDGTKVRGNVTFHAIAGFPLTDIRLDFDGNRSSLYFTGNANITYASYGGVQINETVLDQILADLKGNATGKGPGSLYNMTGGYLECVQVGVVKTPWSNPALGAYVGYNATVSGNFTGAIAYLMFPQGSPAHELRQFTYAALESVTSSVMNASLVLTYYHGSQTAQVDVHLKSDVAALCNSLLILAPSTAPSYWPLQRSQIEALLKIANASVYALDDAGYSASYSSAERKLSMNQRLLVNVSKLKNDVLPFLADTAPPSMHELFESFFNSTYCSVTSSTSEVHMANGTETFNSTVILHGDFKAELNHVKSFLMAAANSSSPSMTLPWVVRLLNATEIDINNLQAEFGIGQDWMHASFTGLILKPQTDDVDLISFKLKNWLNTATDPAEPPVDFEQLTITVEGGSNAGQTVLLYQSAGVPAADNLSGDYRTMAWNNVSLSSLKDLTFLIACQRKISYNARTYDVPIFTNSTVTDFVFDPAAKQVTFNVTGQPGTGFCNVTIAKNLLNATALSDWTVKLDGRSLASGEFSITENAEYVFVYLNYTHSEHEISIKGTWIVPEFQPSFLPLILAISGLIASIVAIKKRRKLEPFAHAHLVTKPKS